ncbi:MAG: phosphate acetyltransferase [Desulfovibrio sp.]|nr:phosphate acetyltransferase [Desulfovibrio sp.]
MANTLFVTGVEPRSGKSAIILGLMQLLSRDIQRVAFFRPIISASEASAKDHDINLVMSQFHADMRYSEAYSMTMQKAREMINLGQHEMLLEKILNDFNALKDRFDFILCEGTDFLGSDSAFEFDINADLAANLGCPVLLVCNGQKKSQDEIIASALLTIESFEDKGLDILAAIINRVEDVDGTGMVEDLKKRIRCPECFPIYVIPEEAKLGKPTVADVTKWLNAKVLYGADMASNLVDNYVIAAMQLGNFLNYLERGSLVITPGDRSDIILGSLASRLSTNYPDISGILLTGGLTPSSSVTKLIEGWVGAPIPILVSEGHTFKTVRVLYDLYGRIEPGDQNKIQSALRVFEEHVDLPELRAKLVAAKTTTVTPKMFEFNLILKAKSRKQHIVLPEGTGERILRAADILLRRGVADITLLGRENEIKTRISQFNLELEGVQIVEPGKSPHYDDYVNTYFELRKHKGIREEDARDRMLDPTYFSTMMVYKGHADGMVSGSVTTTQQTIRPAFEIIKTKPGAKIVSSVFLMCLKDRVLVYGDCAVNPNPTAEELAEIALSSAETARIFGIEPRVAMLSYSTGSSGKGHDVEKVIEATRIAKERAPELLIEGPLQYDAAVDMEVAQTKLPDSLVAGRATVFIFPDLNTGNNTYKAVQRSAQAVAIGPVLQGLNKPVNDLSRGCTVPDIVNTVAITAIQAQAVKGQGE